MPRSRKGSIAGGPVSLIVLILLGVSLLPLSAQSLGADTDAANAAFQAGRYDEAATQFQKLVDAHGYSAPLLFNEGNAQLKAGHMGAAILSYERARYLAPWDERIDRNLQMARHQAGLQPDPYRWWQVALRGINWVVWLVIMLTALVLILLAILGYALSARQARVDGQDVRGWRRLFKGVLFVCIPLAMFFGFVELSAIGFDDRIEGVVTAKQAALHLSPFESSEKSGSISEGELVTVESRHGDYFWVDNRTQSGWINASDFAPVVPGSLEPRQ